MGLRWEGKAGVLRKYNCSLQWDRRERKKDGSAGRTERRRAGEEREEGEQPWVGANKPVGRAVRACVLDTLECGVLGRSHRSPLWLYLQVFIITSECIQRSF